MRDVNHLASAPLAETPGLFPGSIEEENIERNGAMLRNLFEPLVSGLQRACGTSRCCTAPRPTDCIIRDVGADRMRNPLREREPRIPHRNFYFVQEDYLHDKQAAADSWGLTVFRPTVIYGDAVATT